MQFFGGTTVDLEPKTVTFEVKGAKTAGSRRLRASVDPENEISEITDENNAWEVALP